MKIINNNPYRIIGILVGASAREKERQIRKLKQYLEAEQQPQDDFSFPALSQVKRTIETVTDAASKLNLDNDKIILHYSGFIRVMILLMNPLLIF